MLAYDFIDIFPRFAAIPDAFRIDDHGRAELAAVEAAGIIDARAGDFQFFDPLFHVIAQVFGVFFSAAATCMAGFAAVGATEYVLPEKAHGYRLYR